jgi:CRP/FNR family cyclic AMP-dependent transcriptional regulator
MGALKLVKSRGKRTARSSIRSRRESAPASKELEPTPHSDDHEPFDVETFLETSGIARRIAEYRRGEVIFRQGDPCDSVLYIQKGRVKLSVVSKTGKQAVVAILGPGDFLGEGGLAGQPVRIESAAAISSATILFVDQDEMVRLLHEEHAMADRLISHLLTCTIRFEEDLLDQLFSPSEKRLARKLLLLAQSNQPGQEVRGVPPVSQETLAEWVGTTRSRVNVFMKKFERMGFIDYKDGLRVHSSLLAVVLHD